jgi:hypothetical protein
MDDLHKFFEVRPCSLSVVDDTTSVYAPSLLICNGHSIDERSFDKESWRTTADYHREIDASRVPCSHPGKTNICALARRPIARFLISWLYRTPGAPES